MAGGIEGLDVAGHRLGAVAEDVEVDVGDRHVGAETGGHECGVAAHNAGSEHEHLGGLHARYATEQHTASALRFFEEAGAFLDRHSAGHLAHRDEQRETVVAVGDGLVGDAGCAAFEHGVEERTVAGEVEICEEELSFADQLVFRFDRLFHLDDHVGGGVDVFDCGEDLCAGGHILLVVEAGAVAGSVLHEQFMAVGHEFLHSRGGSADAVFIVFDLFGNSDFHKVLRF